VAEAIASGASIREIFHVAAPGPRVAATLRAAAAMGIPQVAVGDAVMGRLTSTVTPQGVVAVCGFVDRPLADMDPAGGLVLVLVEIRDPGNAGSILRSADAAGAAAVVFSGPSVDVHNPKTVRASAGSLFHLPVAREPNPDRAIGTLRGRGFRILAATAGGDASIHDADMTGSVAVLFGNEAHGLSERHRALADATVRVPIRGRAESLNLGAVAAVVLFEAARQRDRSPRGPSVD
jgi:TrmH family RNA methyltransferase